MESLSLCVVVMVLVVVVVVVGEEGERREGIGGAVSNAWLYTLSTA